MEDRYDNSYKESYTLIQIRDNETKTLLSEEYRNAAGQLDRGGLPSLLDYDRETGKLREIEYYNNGVLHRDDGPAVYSIDPETDVVTLEYWFNHGKQHREGGLPAVIARCADGRIRSRSYYINGVQVGPDLEGIAVNKLVRDGLI